MNDASQDPKDVGAHLGLRCGKCGHREFKVIYTRRAPGQTIVRRRECLRCGTRLTTKERIVCGRSVVK